jgi:DNA-binding beta-propeller fold protein YncE
VWIGGNGGQDHVVLKLTSDGSACLLQIGEWGVAGDNDSEDLLNRPADGDTDDPAREVYIADGYGSRRVAVFDMDTGEFKRRWMAPGHPEDPWGGPVHCSVLSNDGLVYVCDRPNNRVHVFETDGTFVEEFFIAPETPGNGSVWDVDFSADRAQTFLYDADGENQRTHILRRAHPDLGVIAEFGRGGRYAGMFHWIHNLSTDSRGNIYVAEVSEGKRTQKFDFRGFRPVH